MFGGTVWPSLAGHHPRHPRKSTGGWDFQVPGLDGSPFS